MKTDDESTRVGVDATRPWTLSHTGQKVYYLEPTIDMFNISDISHHCSQLCRFTGGTKFFYSVLQHMVLVASLVKEQLDNDGVDDQSVEYWDQILAALLHDASEYVVNDIASSLKDAIRGRYKWIEHGILQKIFQRYGIDWGYHNATVKAADNVALQIERFYLMPDHPDWPKVPASEMTYPSPALMPALAVRKHFLDAFRMCITQRNSLRAEASEPRQ